LIVLILALSFTGLVWAEQFVYPDEADRDPFESLLSSDGTVNLRLMQKSSNLKLSGIIYAEDDKGVAVINNFLVKKGDFVGKYKVVMVLKDKVILNKDGEEVILEPEGGQ